jgi:carboxyl-terminal processing protease
VQFNDQHPATNPITGQPLSPTPFFSTAQGFSVPQGQALPTLGLSRVFVLTGHGTASASELFINGLRGAGVQVIQIGETTNGKPYGFYPQDNCGTLYFSIQLRGVNFLDYGDYTDGFIPSAVDNGEDRILGCVVADDFSQQLGDPAEDRLEVALAYIEGQGCVDPVALANDRLGIAVVRDTEGEPQIMRPAVETLRIMRKP